MISVTELLSDRSIRGNFFAPEVYVQGDFESGLIENRNGARLLALPEVLLKGIFAALENELGSSASVVLFKWGFRWGKNFYRRFAEEVSEYYGISLSQMEMVQFLQCLKQCWKTYGWGLLDLDASYYPQGFLVFQIQHSAFAYTAPKNKQRMGYAEAGILSAFCSQLSGRNLHCIQTQCESMGAGANTFVVGLSERLKPVAALLEEGHDHTTVMERLCHQSVTPKE